MSYYRPTAGFWDWIIPDPTAPIVPPVPLLTDVQKPLKPLQEQAASSGQANLEAQAATARMLELMGQGFTATQAAEIARAEQRKRLLLAAGAVVVGIGAFFYLRRRKTA